MLAALEAAAEALGTGVFAAQVDIVPARIVYASPEAARMLGRPLSEVIGAAPWDILPMFERSRLRTLIEGRDGQSPPLFLEYRAERADGTNFPVEVGVARVQTADGLLAVGYCRDVTKRTEAVEALRVSEARFRTLVEGAPDGVVITRDRRILFMNAEAARLLGVASPEAGIGRDLLSLMPPEEAARAGERIGAMLRTGLPSPPSEYMQIVDGQERYVEIKSILVDFEGRPSVLAFARDATERRRLEHELIRADKLAAVGTLAAAVAHEINNPLTYAHLSLQHIERELLRTPDDARAVALLEHVRNARHGAERVATIVRDLRAFARVEDAAPGPVDVVAVVERALKIAENDLRHRARLVRRYEEVPLIEGNGSRLEQVFLNLLINAIQALPDGDPSRDVVTVEIRRGGPREVIVAVTDTGCGVPAAVRRRVFDPFFTTKPVGEGTGLGLSVCRSIIEALGGRITLENGDGAGTRVEVVLVEHQTVATSPLASVPAAAEPALAPSAEPRPLRVLVVDDEPLVRRVLSMVLDPHHEVTCVDGGAEALALLDAPGAVYDVILCDLMMPGMSGSEVHEEVARRHPGLERKIVFVTGGAFVPRLSDFLDSVDNIKLLKPFDVQQVLNAVRSASER
jgi:PAS domain S-box-containing protein